MPHMSKVLKLFKHTIARSDLRGSLGEKLVLFEFEKTSFIKANCQDFQIVITQIILKFHLYKLFFWNDNMSNTELTKIDAENFSKYLKAKKRHFNLSNEALGLKLGVSEGEVSKIITNKRKKVSLRTFYLVAINSGDSIEKARDYVYPHRDFTLNKIDPNTNSENSRSKFGAYMEENFETDSIKYVPGKHSFEIIQQKTGITEKRLKEIYFKTGAPEPFEFLLIEKAVGKKPGVMMKDYIEKHANSSTDEE